MIPTDHSATGPSLSATGRHIPALCPNCGGKMARRSHWDGFAEKMLSLFYVSPFRCQLCGHRFLALDWRTRSHPTPATPVAVDYRDYHRYTVQIPVELSGRHGTPRGRTLDLSLGGCTLLASGPCRDVLGLHVRLQLPNEPRPILVEEAAVRTVQGRRIGVEFLRVAPNETERLGRYIEWISTRSASDCGERPSCPVPSAAVPGTASPPNFPTVQATGKR